MTYVLIGLCVSLLVALVCAAGRVRELERELAVSEARERWLRRLSTRGLRDASAVVLSIEADLGRRGPAAGDTHAGIAGCAGGGMAAPGGSPTSA